MSVLRWTLLPALLSAPALAIPPEDTCQAAITAVERTAPVPPQLLSAIARVESGRPAAGRTVAWPWTLNVAGTGYYYASAPEAAAAIGAFQAAGIQSIDIGCMQVNLQHHPAAFASLQAALDPPTNVAYAARFLVSLHGELGTWPQAAAAYHSRTPERAAAYGRRVMQAWPLALSYGGAAMLAGVPNTVADVSPAVVDPYGVYTPEFTRRLAANAAARTGRGVAQRAEAPARPSALERRFASQLRVQPARGSALLLAQANPRRRP